MDEAHLNQSARQLVESLRSSNRKAVLAESCTCGRTAAALGTVTGVSQNFCGGWVVYRPRAKSDWLGLDPDWLERVSTESLDCSRALALAALERTGEADLSLAITGDLAPEAPQEKSGVVHLAAAGRSVGEGSPQILLQETRTLAATSRPDRQIEAATRLIELGIRALDIGSRGE